MGSAHATRGRTLRTIAVWLALLTTAPQAQMKPFDLRIEQVRDPLGLDVPAPRF